jgi:NADH:ubiquinone oxidoreductase subunit 2 (subunit N)
MNALVGAYYALRVITVLYMAAPVPDPELGTLGWRMRVPLLLASLATIALGVLPSSVMELARRAALELF